MPGFKVQGTDDFQRVARNLKAAGRGDLARKMGQEMKQAVEPARLEMQSNVRALRSSGGRGGASARAARAAHTLRKRRNLTDRARLKAFRGSGLRETVARATRTTASAGSRSASVRIRAAQAQMPPSQRKLPRLLNRGHWRHPVFGGRWTAQKASPAGWFDRPAKKHRPKVRYAAVAVVARTVRQLG
jgi:hypothetical protein